MKDGEKENERVNENRGKKQISMQSVGGGGGEIGATPRAHVHQAARERRS